MILGRDRVEVDGAPVAGLPGLVYYALNKPAGVVTTARDPQRRPAVSGLVPPSPRVFPVGRLDADTEGLLVLTNDGELAQRLSHPSFGVEKEYLVEVKGALRPPALRALRSGVALSDGKTAPAKVSVVSGTSSGVIRITIHEGRNRQVRRMLEAVGSPVTRLVRVRIGPLRLRDLKPGHWRRLSPKEVHSLSAACGPRGAKRSPSRGRR